MGDLIPAFLRDPWVQWSLVIAIDVGALLVGYRTISGRASQLEGIAFWPLLAIGFGATVLVMFNFAYSVIYNMSGGANTTL